MVVPDSQAQPLQEAASGVRPQRLRSSTGVELQVAERGPADGEPVLFLLGQ